MLAGGVVHNSMAARIGKSSVSTPFDQAWVLLKMPIVPGSLKQTGDKYSAQFIDPISEERLSINAEEDDRGINRIEIPNRAYTNIEHSGYEHQGRPMMQPEDSETYPEYQRRGYMSAMYDLAAKIARDKYGGTLQPGAQVGSISPKLWAGKPTDSRDTPNWPVREDLE